MAPEPRPYLIAVGGCSCSGKTELSQQLAVVLSCPLLPIDAYYRALGHLDLAQRAAVNFDEPGAIDAALLFEDIGRLAQGETVKRPVYDYAQHTRSRDTVPVKPERFVIIEGLFALYWDQARSNCQTKVFIDLDHAMCLARRLERDVRERGRTPESVEKQYAETVRPMADRYVIPTRAYADIVVRGDDPLDRSLAAILRHIDQARNSGL